VDFSENRANHVFTPQGSCIVCALTLGAAQEGQPSYPSIRPNELLGTKLQGSLLAIMRLAPDHGIEQA
jgi:hypothetical protein